MQRKKRMRKTISNGRTDVANRTRRDEEEQKRMVRCLESMLIGYRLSYDKKIEKKNECVEVQLMMRPYYT